MARENGEQCDSLAEIELQRKIGFCHRVLRSSIGNVSRVLDNACFGVFDLKWAELCGTRFDGDFVVFLELHERKQGVG